MYGCLTFLISALLTGVIGVSTDLENNYIVSSVNSTVSLTTFECRLRNDAQPTEARFTVHLRGVRASEKASNDRVGRDFFHQQLTTADCIQLRNVHDHGYFVLTADVYADGRNLAEDMLEKGFLCLSDEWPPPEPGEQPALRRVPIDRDTADRSLSIRPETTLHEALTQLSAATQPQLPMLILWNDLEHNALIDRDTPVGIELQGRMRLGQALRLVLQAASPDVRLAAQEDGGVWVIATRDGIGRRYHTGVYPVADITSPPSPDHFEQGDFHNRAPRR